MLGAVSKTLSRVLRFISILCVFTCCACGGGGDSADANADAQVSARVRRIVFFGDSLTSGYTLPREQAYPSLVNARLIAENVNATAINSGETGNTTANGLARIDVELQQPIDVFVEALGVNDAENKLPATVAEANIQAIFDRVRLANPGVKLVVAGMDVPKFMTRPQLVEYQAMFQRLAAANGATLIPNFLAGVTGNRDLNLPDHIHPNAAGHQLISQTMFGVLVGIL